MKTFLTIWSGQLISRIGTAMTRFALIIWAYEQTGTATTLALLGFATFVPMIVVSPFAGVWVDRLDRRHVLQFADLGAGLVTVGLLALFATGSLQIWHIYLTSALAGVFEAFQIPAYTAASSVLLPKEQYARASGLRSLSTFGAEVIAPVLGGLLLAPIGMGGVMLIDMATFLFALGTLMVVQIPKIEQFDGEETAVQLSFMQDMRFGFSYIWQRSGLLGFTVLMTLVILFSDLTWFSIMHAMILARSGNNELTLVSVQSAMGMGGMLGGLLISTWGGPRNRVHGVLLGIVLSCVVGDIALGLSRTTTAWMLAAASGGFCIPLIGSSYQALWQAKIRPQLQGRVFSSRDMVTRTVSPISYLLGGLLADNLLEPALVAEGPLASTIIGRIMGTGPGAGMGLMFVLSGSCVIAICLSAYLFPAIRNIEQQLPDHDAVKFAQLRG